MRTATHCPFAGVFWGRLGTVTSSYPAQYFFHGATGLLTKVRYTSGADTADAVYAYDGLGRMTRLTDWLDAVNGLRYAYDAAGRLTMLTDYDDATLDYAYDAAGNVTGMTDYHGNSTSYTYTDRGELHTLTTPGAKTWTWTYNALGQPTQVAIPNGITTAYGYDTRNRLTKIEHKDGSTVLDGFTYALTPGGNITRTDQADGSYWTYGYDGRERLTKADRYHAPGSGIHAGYTYAYDAADNMVSKSEPFIDDVDDGNYTGWTVSGTWTAANGYVTRTSAPFGAFYRSQTDRDFDLRFRFRLPSATVPCRHDVSAVGTPGRRPRWATPAGGDRWN